MSTRKGTPGAPAQEHPAFPRHFNAQATSKHSHRFVNLKIPVSPHRQPEKQTISVSCSSLK